jgi:hypothetical protein
MPLLSGEDLSVVKRSRFVRGMVRSKSGGRYGAVKKRTIVEAAY